MPQLDGSIRIGTEITTKEAQKELKSLESSITKTADKIASLRSKMDALKDVKIPTGQYKEYEKILAGAENRLTSLYKEQKKFLAGGGKRSAPAYQKMVSEVEQLERKISGITKVMDLLERRGEAFTLGSDTDEYAQMAAQMQQLNQQMQADTQRQSELQSALAAEEQRLVDIKANAAESDQQMISLLERRRQLTKDIADMEKAGLGYGYQEYDSAQQELSAVNNQIREYKDNLATVPERFSRMHKSAQKAFSVLGSGISKSSGLFSILKNSADNTFQTVSRGARQSTGLMSTFAGRLKGLAASAFIFNLISKGFNSMVSSMKAGFTNLMGYSGSFANSIQSVKNSLSTLGNQISAAFAPVVQAVIPWLNQLISALSVAMSYLAQFIAALTGKGTYIRAKKVQDSYNASLGGTAKKEDEAADNADNLADSLGDTEKAAKKARGALAAFDDLDVLEKQDESTDAAADKIKDLNNQLKDLGNGAGGGMGDLFEEVPVESSILDAAEKLKDILAQLFAPLKEAWEREGQFVMDSWKYALSEIWQLMKDIGSDFLTMWNQEATIKMFADILHIVGDIGLVAGNITHALDKAWNKNKTGLHILENIRDIFAVIVHNIREAADYTVQWSKTLDFSPLLESIEHLTKALVPFADFVSGTLSDFYTQFLLPMASWTMSEDGIPRLINILGDFMDAVDWEVLREALKNLYIALEPYAEAIGEGLIDFIGKLKDIGADILNALPEPIQKLADALASGDPQKVREWTTTILEFAIAIEGIKLAFSAIESVRAGLALFGIGGSVATAGTTAAEAAVGVRALSGAIGDLAVVAAGLGVLEMLKTLIIDFGEAIGQNAVQMELLEERYRGLDGNLRALQDGFDTVKNGLQGYGFAADNATGQGVALEKAMNDIADGAIYTEQRMAELQDRFSLTDEDMEMLRQSMLDMHPELRFLADNFVELENASAESLEEIYFGLQDVSNGIYDADDATAFLYGRFGNLTESTKVFFDNMATGVTTIDDYRTSLESASDAIQIFSNDIELAGTNISTGITEGFENADVETPVKGFFARTVESLRSVFDMHSPAKNMEPFGENILLGVLEGFKNNFSVVQDAVSEFFQSMKFSFSENLQNIHLFFAEAWTKIYESTVDTWSMIQTYFTEFWTLFIEYMTETWEEILLVFTENFEEIQLLFEEFTTFLNEIFLVSWLETWTLAGEQYQAFHDLLMALTKALQDMLTLFMKKVKEELINTIWKQSWKNAENIFEEFKNKVEELSNNIREIVQSLFEFVMGLVSQMLAAIESIGSAAASISGGGFSAGGGGVTAMSSYSTHNFAAYTADIPMLASGAVIRGGNPFMAILGDQPRGQINVETPAGLIRDMVREGIREEMGNLQISGGQIKVAVQVNGADLAQVTLDDFLSEMNRQGYNVDLLGYT